MDDRPRASIKFRRVKEKGGMPTARDHKRKVAKKQNPPTIAVMFVDQTPGGLMAKKLQEVEDKLAPASGYRIRMVETSGTQLQRLLPNTNPWAGTQDCGWNSCYTCGQGGKVLQDCKRRNILWLSIGLAKSNNKRITSLFLISCSINVLIDIPTRG